MTSDVKAVAAEDDDIVRRQSHDMMRRAIAKRLTESKQTVPHFYLTVDCDLDALLALRQEINAAAAIVDGAPAWKLSLNDFMIKATAVALAKVPAANVTWTDDALVFHGHADIAVAVAVPGGLMTPVLRHVDEKSVQTVSAEMKDYAARARTRRLRPEEYRGGTISVSNLGMYGVRDFGAIINPPHAAILAIGAGEERIVARDHKPAVVTQMSVTMSTDHRAVDGAVGAEFLAAFRAAVEHPREALI
jgi:pyruvate dehydrogenase E2 component (dihydrolipoamide acetyltransferase)